MRVLNLWFVRLRCFVRCVSNWPYCFKCIEYMVWVGTVCFVIVTCVKYAYFCVSFLVGVLSHMYFLRLWGVMSPL